MVDIEVKDALKTAKPFKYLNSNELDMLILHSKITSFNPGDVVLQQGKKCVGLYVIIHGVAFVKAKTLGKELVNLLTVEHGNFVGEIGVLEKDVYATTVIASTKLETLLIPIEYFAMLAIFFPEMKHKISQSIAEEICNRLKIILSRITDYMSHTNMMHLSFYEEIIKSLASKKNVNFEELHINVKQLQTMPFFNELTEDEFSHLLKNSDLILTPPNCPLKREGETDSNCYLILRGAVQLNMTQSNKLAKLAILGPGKFFGNIAIANGSLSLINYNTREKSILLQISQSHLDHIKTTQIELWYKIFELICKFFSQLERMANSLDIRLHSELYNR